MADVSINGGFFVFRPTIFEYIQAGAELVEAPFRRLMDLGRLYRYKYHGFWVAIDTYKDRRRGVEYGSRTRYGKAFQTRRTVAAPVPPKQTRRSSGMSAS